MLTMFRPTCTALPRTLLRPRKSRLSSWEPLRPECPLTGCGLTLLKLSHLAGHPPAAGSFGQGCLICCLPSSYIFLCRAGPERHLGLCAFSVVGPSIWNGLPSELRIFPRALSPAFFSHLKTAIFSRAGVGSASE